MLPLPIHLGIHVAVSLLVGVLTFRLTKKPLASVISALSGGVLIDTDHLIDYFLAFGWNFDFDYFRRGYEFLKNGKLYLFFHGWEYFLVLILVFYVVKNKTAKAIFLGLALGMLSHLFTDVALNEVSAETYLITRRAKNNYEVEKLVLPEEYQRHLIKKQKAGF